MVYILVLKNLLKLNVDFPFHICLQLLPDIVHRSKDNSGYLVYIVANIPRSQQGYFDTRLQLGRSTECFTCFTCDRDLLYFYWHSRSWSCLLSNFISNSFLAVKSVHLNSWQLLIPPIGMYANFWLNRSPI